MKLYPNWDANSAAFSELVQNNKQTITVGTDYGRPMKPFFYQNPKLLGFGRQIGQINYVAFRVFLAKLSGPVLVQ